MPAGTVAGQAEARLRAQAGRKKLKGARADSYVYGTMNKAGLMHGNQPTPKGMAAAHKAAGSISAMARSTASRRKASRYGK